MYGSGLLQTSMKSASSRRGLAGCFQALSLCLVILILPFLLTRGPSLGSPLDQVAVGDAISLPASDLNSQVNGDEQDVCHPVPLDSDPSDDASGMAVHIETHVRKDSNFLHFPARTLLFHLAILRLSADFQNVVLLQAETSALPFSEDYPVFLISDLPPPAA
jgi:hypothetical protein